MIDRILTLLLFLTVSFLDLRVHAEALTLPKGCLEKPISCSVQAEKNAFGFQMRGGEIRLLKNAQLKKVNAYRLQHMSGAVLVKASEKPIVIDTLYARVEVQSGSVLIEKVENQIRAHNLSGDVRFQLKGATEKMMIPEGLLNEFGPVQANGRASSQYPRSISLSGFVEMWAKFYVKNEFESFKAEFETFLPKWREGLKFVGPWYLETINRQLADQKEEEMRLQRLREQRLKEENYYREMFRRKNFID